MTRTKLGFVCFVAARNCMRQQVAGRSSQRHATLPTYYKVVHRTEKVLLCTTLYYKALIQYYSVLPSTTPVLQSATPVLLCTTNYYSSTTLYYKVLLQYYSVLQSTTPVLLRTTQYYSSTTPVLLCTTKYYSGTRKYCSSTTPVLQSTTPVLICKVPSHMTRYLQCAEQQESAANFSKYCACHEKWISCLILVAHETLFTMRGGTSAIVQTHQILRLPRKMNLMIDPCHTWNAIYNARSNTCHCPNSPNTAPATKNESHDWSLSHVKRYLQCAEQQASLSKLTKYCACHAKWFSKISETFLQNRWNVNYNARPIREWSELDPSWIRAGNRHPQPASQPRLLFRTTTSILYWKIQHFALRLSFQISPNTAPATKSDTSTSPNTAPATQNDSHHWSS